MDKESIFDANNVTVDTFSHTSNKQKENANAIFTSENLDKLDNLSDVLNYLTINNAEHYASNSTKAGDAKGNLTRDPKTVIHTSNGKE